CGLCELAAWLTRLLFYSCQEHAQRDAFSGLLDFRQFRKTGRDPDDRVLRIVAMRMSRTSRCQLNASLLGKFHDMTGRATRCFQRDEITALRRRPRRGAARSQMLLEQFDDAPELRGQDFAMPIHQCFDAGGALEQSHMT